MVPFSLLIFMMTGSCESVTGEKYEWKELNVTVTAFNSVSWQTDGKPSIAAWGDTLKPGMKAIAVSRDLLQLGMLRNTPVKIEGLPGIYYVKDKMHAKWKNKIDIYMGKDVEKARKWGRKKLSIQYGVPKVKEKSGPDTSS